jgi:cyclin-dependent kinase
MASKSNWRASLGATDRYANIEKLYVHLSQLSLGPILIYLCRRKNIEAKGLSSTGTAHKTAFDTEAEAYNTSESRVSDPRSSESLDHVTTMPLFSSSCY